MSMQPRGRQHATTRHSARVEGEYVKAGFGRRRFVEGSWRVRGRLEEGSRKVRGRFEGEYVEAGLSKLLERVGGASREDLSSVGRVELISMQSERVGGASREDHQWDVGV